MSSMELAENFYQFLEVNPAKAAVSLHGAVKKLRSLKLQEPSLWASYVCVGL